MFTKALIDLIFPPICVNCGNIGGWVCKDCLEHSFVTNRSECIVCRKRTKSFETHNDCLEKYGIDRGIVCWKYGEIEKKVMSTFKYNYRYAISDYLSQKMCEHAKPFLNKKYLVTSVPLHPQKKRDRGFNQSELLARGICNHFGFDYVDALQRTADSHQHAGMNRKARLQDGNPFELINKNIMRNQNILLVDDVCTTGSTLFNCASELKKGSPKSISTVVLFRGKQAN